MNTPDLYASNIENLTDLWKAMGAQSSEPDEGSILHTSQSWPHRLWFDVEVQPTRADAARMVAAARSASRPVVLPTWYRVPMDDLGSTNETCLANELRAASYDILFEQAVMVLDLSRWSCDTSAATDIEFHGAKGETESWAEIASESFGYTVDTHVIDRVVAAPGVNLLLAKKNGHPVGTGLSYSKGEIVGIHLVGVPPKSRRMGIARKIMIHLLDDARSRGSRYATLQASAMGEGLYREMGFESLGWLYNFAAAENSRRS